MKGEEVSTYDLDILLSPFPGQRRFAFDLMCHCQDYLMNRSDCVVRDMEYWKSGMIANFDVVAVVLSSLAVWHLSQQCP